MDAPPPREDVRPVPRRGAAAPSASGLSAPRILADDAEAGLLLLEDFGDDTFTRLLAAGAGGGAALCARGRCADRPQPALRPRRGAVRCRPMTRRGCSPRRRCSSIGICRRSPARPPRPLCARELSRAVARAAAAGARRAGDAGAARLSRRQSDAASTAATASPPAACSISRTRCWGRSSYDLVSLLEDARRDVAPARSPARCGARFLAAFPALDRAAFDALLRGAGRRSATARSSASSRGSACATARPSYLAHIPRVWRLIEADLRHPALAPLARWLDRHVPPARAPHPAVPARRMSAAPRTRDGARRRARHAAAADHRPAAEAARRRGGPHAARPRARPARRRRRAPRRRQRALQGRDDRAPSRRAPRPRDQPVARGRRCSIPAAASPRRCRCSTKSSTSSTATCCGSTARPRRCTRLARAFDPGRHDALLLLQRDDERGRL